MPGPGVSVQLSRAVQGQYSGDGAAVQPSGITSLKTQLFTSFSYCCRNRAQRAGSGGGRGQAHTHLLSSSGRELLTSGSDTLALLQSLLFVVSLNSEQLRPSPTHLKCTGACLCFFLKVYICSVPRSGRCVDIPGYPSGRGDHCPCGISLS